MSELLSRTEYRCKLCSRLLFRGTLQQGSVVEIPCWHRQCRYMNMVKVDKPERILVR